MNWVLITSSFFLTMISFSIDKSSTNKMNNEKKINKTMMKWSW